MKVIYTLLYLGFLIFLPFLWEYVSYIIGQILTLNDGGGFMADLIPDIFWGGVMILFVGGLYILIISFFFKQLYYISKANSVMLVPIAFLLAYLICPSILKLDNYPVSDKRLYMHLVAMGTLLLSLPAYYQGKKDKKRREAIERAMGLPDKEQKD
jgi:hypothetical protein